MTKRQATPARRLWSWVEEELLRRNFSDSLTSDLAIVLGRTERQVLAKANSMGLHKSKTLIAELARERSLRPGHGSEATRFQKGLVPFNKGLRRPGWAPGNMASTQFKKGQKPVTWVPVGSYRIKDECLERKVTDLPGPPGVRWKPVHMLVWVEANGPVPDGCVVVFKAGRRTTDLAAITLDAVELVTRAQLMKRNSIHAMHPQLAEVSRLRGALKRAINRRSEKESQS